jgi:hypothetical protein
MNARSLRSLAPQLGLIWLHFNQPTRSVIPPIKLTNRKTFYISKNRLKTIDGLAKNHGSTMSKLVVHPNQVLPYSDIIRIRNMQGIIYRAG